VGETGTADALLDTLLARAGAKARTSRRAVLASKVERIAAVDLLSVMEAARNAAQSDSAVAALIATRMYWTRVADRFTLAGLGAAVTFAPEGADRFATIDREWSALVADAIVEDPSGGAAGAGPMLMGGFAFDPEGPRTEQWRDFPAAHLIVPRLQLACSGGECWLTTTLLVGTDAQPDIDPATLARLRSTLLDAARRSAGAGARLQGDEHLSYGDARDASAWRETVRVAVDAIHAGRIEKVVLAREVRTTATRNFDATGALRHMREAHPACYVFGFWHGDSVFAGATPERLVRADGRNIQASSLAGSVRRGATPDDDAARADELLASGKDRAEHEFVRRALCAGLERLCDDVTAEDGPSLLSLPNVHHLHTAVHARLRPGHTLLQIVAQLHPTPAVGGSPRNAALRFIREHESMDRGWYAAPIGWLQRDRGEFAVALRSALISGPGAALFAGCGVVSDSDPEQEYAESLLKLRPMKMSLAVALAPHGNATSDATMDVEDDALERTPAPALCTGDAS
jgi:isochorismate synthase